MENRHTKTVPEGWNLKTVEQVFDFYPTATYSRDKQVSQNTEASIKYIHYGDIHTKYNILLDASNPLIPHIDGNLKKDFELVKDGDLIIADTSEDYDGVGKCIEIVNVGDNRIISGLHTLMLRPKGDDFIDGFKGYFFSGEQVRNCLLRIVTGIKVYSIAKTTLAKVNLQIPSHQEQKAFVSILSKVDEAIASVQNSIAAAERLKKSLMQNLLTGRMKPDGTFRTPEEFYIDEKFGKVPVGWGVKRVDEVFDFYPTASYSRSMLKEDGECKYIHYGDIHTRFDIFLDISEESLPYITNDMIKKFVFLKDGDIVISDTSEDYDGVGKLVELINVGESKVISGLHTLLLRPKTDELLNGFKGYLFNEERVRLEFLKYVTGIKVYSISKNSLSKVLLPIPTRIEQEQIKENLDAVNNEMYVSKNKIKKLERLKKSLMQNLLTGRVSMARS